VTRVLGSRASWALLGLVAVVLLVIGSINPPSSAASARIARLDSIIKCPACEDLSIAESDAPTSVTLRNEVATWVHAGWTDQRIEQVVMLLYALPLGAIAAAAACLSWFFWRRHRRLTMARASVPS
jgi:cytochrome c-type biogenesis protein CcmH/NrfF